MLARSLQQFSMLTRFQKLWLLLFLVSIVGIILMVINTYAFYEYSGSSDSKINYRTNEEEYLILPYYFTFISNVTAVIVSGIATRHKGRLGVHFERYKVMMATNLTVTLVVYWALLSGGIEWSKPLGVTSNIFVHLVTPVLAVSIFSYSRKEYDQKTLTIRSTVGFNFIMPIVWVAFAIIMYFIFGADGKQDVPYAFLDILHNQWYFTLVIVLAIAVAYLLLTALYAYVFRNDFEKLKRLR